jgi:hypothetical protein
MIQTDELGLGFVGATFRRHGLPKPRCKLLEGFIETALSRGFYKPLELCWISSSQSLLSLCDDFCHRTTQLRTAAPVAPDDSYHLNTSLRTKMPMSSSSRTTMRMNSIMTQPALLASSGDSQRRPPMRSRRSAE